MYLLLPYIREMSAMSFPRSILLILALSVVAACGSDSTTDPQPQTTIAVSSGNAQSAQSSQALASPIVVRVARDGAALAGTSVSWSVASGGGSVAPGNEHDGWGRPRLNNVDSRPECWSEYPSGVECRSERFAGHLHGHSHRSGTHAGERLGR